jgi:hypothetical protein
MSEEEPKKKDDDFDTRLWLLDLHVSDPGIAKIVKNEIDDENLLLRLSSSDILDLKLSVGDKRRFLDGITVLRGKSLTLELY